MQKSHNPLRGQNVMELARHGGTRNHDAQFRKLSLNGAKPRSLDTTELLTCGMTDRLRRLLQSVVILSKSGIGGNRPIHCRSGYVPSMLKAYLDGRKTADNVLFKRAAEAELPNWLRKFTPLHNLDPDVHRERRNIQVET